MTEAIKTCRCRACRAEFTDAEVEGANCCPACQSRSIPLAIEQDLDMRLNWGDLRLLGIWASNWAETFNVESPGDMAAKTNLHRLLAEIEKKYRKPGWPALTMIGEFKELQEHFPNASLYSGGECIVPPKEEAEGTD